MVVDDFSFSHSPLWLLLDLEIGLEICFSFEIWLDLRFGWFADLVG